MAFSPNGAPGAAGWEDGRARAGNDSAAILGTYAQYDDGGLKGEYPVAANESLLRYTGNPVDSNSYVVAEASHQDVIYFNGPGIAPDYLSLSFRVEGRLGVDGYYPQYLFPVANLSTSILAQGYFLIGSSPPPGIDYLAGSFDGEVYRIPGPHIYSNTFGQGFDNATIDGDHFVEYFHINSYYDARLGGYGWQVDLASHANGYGTIGEADEFHTLGLASITDPGGNPIDNLLFASGMTFSNQQNPNPVPEPSSLCLIAIAIVCGGVNRLRKSRSRLT